MILSVLRKLSEWDGVGKIFEDWDQALLCDDRDYKTAMTIVNCLINHSGRVYSVLKKNTTDPFAKITEKPKADTKKLYEAIPSEREIETAEIVAIGKSLDISERTTKRYIGDLVNKFHVLERLKQGVYYKKVEVSK